jgi:hypothetical protein
MLSRTDSRQNKSHKNLVTRVGVSSPPLMAVRLFGLVRLPGFLIQRFLPLKSNLSTKTIDLRLTGESRTDTKQGLHYEIPKGRRVSPPSRFLDFGPGNEYLTNSIVLFKTRNLWGRVATAIEVRFLFPCQQSFFGPQRSNITYIFCGGS